MPSAPVLSSRPGNEVVARLRAGGARADVGEVDVKRIGELHAVVAAGEVRHMQNLRSFTEVQPADRKERVVVHANSHQIRASEAAAMCEGDLQKAFGAPYRAY